MGQLDKVEKTDEDDIELWGKRNVWAMSGVESNGEGGIVHKTQYGEQKKLANLLGDVAYQ